MAISLTNFKAIGLEDRQDEIHIDDNGRITKSASPTSEKVNCDGAYLSAGWCDLHVHVWHGGTDISVRPQEAGRRTGVTAMADAGSAGEANFHGLREYVIEPSPETIKAFLNISSIGLVACNRVPELIDTRFVDVDRMMEVVDANRDVICGIKVRASGVIVGTWGVGPVRIAKRVAEIAGLPLMAHIGEPPPMIDEVFDILTEGDIVTHCFNGKTAGAITDTSDLFERARQLADKGICLDVGHGAASFNFDTARRAIDGGFFPHTISTDLHLQNINGPVHDMATTASKMMALGLGIEDCISAITRRPRSILKLDSGLESGKLADFTVFALEDREIPAKDSQGGEMVLSQILSPKFTVIGPSIEAAQRRDS